MNAKTDKLLARSLAQHFDAPEGFMGHFGWVCGFSADAAFLDDAAERFTGNTRAQRSNLGRIALALLLDPSNPYISLNDAPSVAHLPTKDVDGKPFRLLHAKIALLGFRNRTNSSQWVMRLVVSTGNWTRQTLEESLDLVWRVDVSSSELEARDEATGFCCADIKAARDLLRWLEQYFDCRLLDASPRGSMTETQVARRDVDAWLDLCEKKAKGKARFFDNRSKSLLEQLPNRVTQVAGETRRNYLAMGSGFYESAGERASAPTVPHRIAETLRAHGLLTMQAEVDLYVNPSACQAVANSVKVLRQSGMLVRAAAQPSAVFGNGMVRSLHAKFLFSAYFREDSNACNSAWVYLGSGNLTGPGFASKMNRNAGNLETGVVFAPEALFWGTARGVEAHQVVTNLLPVQWENSLEGDETELSAGPGLPARDEIYIAPPVAWLAWDVDGNELRVVGDAHGDFAAIDPAGQECRKTSTGFAWPEARPRQVRVRWQLAGRRNCEALVPVVDEHGRIAAADLPKLDLSDALWLLADFPMPPDDGDDGEVNESDFGDGPPRTSGDSRGVASIPDYPIRQMMELVESIATKQTEVNPLDWIVWCNRLEQTLIQAKDSPAVGFFRKLGVNPLGPLRVVCFRPAYAETEESELGQAYAVALSRVERAWGVEEMAILGSMQ